jgi:hypothetical protein
MRSHGVRLPDGLWCKADGPRKPGVSAVITIPRLTPLAITSTEPTVWLNPWATRPFTRALPWRTQEIAPDGRISTREASLSPADLFELSEGWPVEGERV